MYAVGSDHAGFDMRMIVKAYLEKLGEEVLDMGTFDRAKSNYPEIAEEVASGVAAGRFEAAVLICGTGIGMSMAANRHREIRAALCDNCYSAKATREHNDANVLCLGARVLGEGLAIQIVDTFLDTPFSNEERHIRRIRKIEGNYRNG